MKRYPKYKDSGVSWLGQVPAHWELLRFKNIFTELDARRNLQLPAGSISYGKVVYKDDQDMHEPTKDSYQAVLKGDFLINPINLNYDLKSLRTALSEIDVCVSPAYIVLCAAEKECLLYLRHLLYAFDLHHMKTLGSGVRHTITFNDIGTCVAVLPPISEQEKISDFLDKTLGSMDSAIESQERMIELLKERRSAIITQAVTKGLNPNAKMKDSGVPWLGQIPSHWEVKALKFLLSLNQGGAWGEDPLGKGDTVVLRSTEQTVTGDWIIEDPAVRSLSEIEQKKTRLQKGDILVTKASGSEAHIGKASLVDDRVASLNAGYSNFMQRLRARPGVDPRLVLFMLNSKAVREQFVYLSNSTSGLGNISSSILNNVMVAEPSTHEQLTVVDYISGECRKIDASIVAEEKLIDLLKERRSAIITQAVTGQIDVR